MKRCRARALSLAAVSLVANNASAATIYFEDFSGQPGESLTGPVDGFDTFTSTNGNWNVTAGDDPYYVGLSGLSDSEDWARVADGFPSAVSTTYSDGSFFKFRDVDNPMTWQTKSIDISNFTNIQLSFGYWEVGNMQPELAPVSPDT